MNGAFLVSSPCPSMFLWPNPGKEHPQVVMVLPVHQYVQRALEELQEIVPLKRLNRRDFNSRYAHIGMCAAMRIQSQLPFMEI
jgi:hypothetical protein